MTCPSLRRHFVWRGAVLLVFRFSLVSSAQTPPEEILLSHYHWALHAWALPEKVLKKIYRENALKLLSKYR